MTAAYFGEGFTGEVPAQFALKGKNAQEQLVALAGMLTAGASDIVNEIAANHQAVFLNLWRGPPKKARGRKQKNPTGA